MPKGVYIRTKKIRRKMGLLISKALKGRKLSEEHKMKISNSHKGKKHSKYTIEKIRKANTGKKVSEKVKKRMCEITRNRHAKGDKFGFQKGHKNFMTEKSIEKLSATMRLQYKLGLRKINRDLKHLKKYQFKNNAAPWNKNVTGYSTKLKGHKHTEETKQKISEALKGKPRLDKRGSNSHFWKGGISKLSDRIRRCNKYKEWREAVFTRDNFTCQECFVRGSYLEAHHNKKEFYIILKENNIATLDDAYSCKEVWDIDNGKTLCLDCHNRNGRPNKKIYT